VLVVIALIAAGASAEPLTLHSGARFERDGLVFNVWGIEEGLPQVSVTGMVQDPDGFLWMTTFGGLTRFDGTHFELFGQADAGGEHQIRFTSLALAGDGGLWVGLEGGGVARFRWGRFEPLDQPKALRQATPHALLQQGGALSVATSSGLFQRDPAGAWRAIPRCAEPGAPDDLWSIAGDGEALWVGSLETTWRVAGDTAAGGCLEPVGPGGRALLAADGALWLGGRGGVWRLGPEGPEAIPSPEDVFAIGQDAEGGLWAAGPGFLASLSAPQRRWSIADAPRGFLQDREGTLWLATNEHGLVQIQPQPYEKLTQGEGLYTGVGVLLADEGGLLFSSSCRGISRLEPDDALSKTRIEEGCFQALLRDRQGRLWGADGAHAGQGALHRLEPPGASRTLGARVLRLIQTRRDGALWAGTEGAGLVRFDGGAPKTRLTRASGLLSDHITALAEAPDGALWVGHPEGISVVEEAQVRRTWSAADGLPRGQVRVIHFDEVGAVWVGTYGGGLGWLRGDRFHRFNREDGLFDHVVSGLQEVDGAFWLKGNRGISRVERQELVRQAEGALTRVRARPFSAGEGNGPWSARLADGRLAFSMVDGLVLLDPEALSAPATPPPILIEEATVDGGPLPTSGEIPPETGGLLVRYTSPSLRWPELVRFQTRLAESGGDWSPPTPERQILLQGLAPGHYTLQIRAIDESGQVSDAPALLRFSQLPRWWQRPIVRALSVSALVAALLLAGLLWTRRLRRHAQALQAEVSQRARAERAARDRELHYRRIFESATDALLIADATGRWVDVNPAACRIFGRGRDALMRAGADALFTDPLNPELPGPREVVGLRADGEIFAARVLCTPYTTEGGLRLLVSVTDGSALARSEADRQSLQERLARAQRLEAVGRLAGGIAHDFNNLLTVILSNVSLLEMILPVEDDEDVSESLQGISEVAHRASNLTRQLLAFSRKQILEPQNFDLGECVRAITPMLDRLIRDDIDLTVDIDTRSHLTVFADPAQVELVIINLCINAVDAMPGGGRLRVRARADDDMAEVSIRDTGTGIPPDVLPHIFDPFFTTKPVGAGTGLGLASAHGIAEQSGGELRVKTAQGEGSSFSLRLPLTSAIALPTRAPEALRGRTLGRGERVLLCDDDDDVRRACARGLQAQGYDLVATSSPDEALALLEDRPVELLLTDVVMPELSGPELAARARAVHPGLRVLFISGYPRESAPELVDEDFLAKPFSPEVLAARVRVALDR